MLIVFNNCILKGTSDPANSLVVASLMNQDPLFDSVDVSNKYFDFHTNINPLAPGINKGKLTGITVDLDGINRNVGLPDMGCYEKQ